MADRCTGLDILRGEELTPFGERLATYYSKNFNGRPLMSSLSPKERAKEARDRLEIPEECPHEQYDEETESCIFHLSSKQKEEKGIDPGTVKQAFLNASQDDSAKVEATKIFVNATLRSLDLQYLDIDAPDNRPIDLRFANIGELYLNQTVLYEKLRIAHAKISSFRCEQSTFLNGLDAEGAQIGEEDLRIVGNEFNRETNFRRIQFLSQRILVEDNDFKGNLNFNEADFIIKQPTSHVDIGADEKNVSFNRCDFYENAVFDDISLRSKHSEETGGTNQVITKNIKITFRYCDYGGNISYNGATFGSWQESGFLRAPKELLNEDEIYNISFTKSEFKGNEVDFSQAKFGGTVDISGTDFSQAAVDVEDVTIDGSLEATDVKFSEKTVDFGGVEIKEDLNFDYTIFENNKMVKFDNCSVRSNASFESARFESKYINFSGFDTQVDKQGDKQGTGGGDLIFENAEMYGKTIDLSDIKVGDALHFERATVEGQVVNFNDVEVPNSGNFEGVQIACEELNFTIDTFGRLRFGFAELKTQTAEFAGARFAKNVVFDNAEFQTRDLVFDNAVFEEAVSFSNTKFTGRVTFNNTHFGGESIDFDDINAEAAILRFVGTSTASDIDDDTNVINFKNAVVPRGVFEQPRSSGTYYDFESATVGDLQLRFHESSTETDRLFEYFRFFETTFDGFDFSRSMYREELKKNNWRLESVEVNEVIDTSSNEQSQDGDTWGLITRPLRLSKQVIQKYLRLLSEGSNPNPELDGLESTYRKAKICADEQGDSDASSKFFQKELQFRRLSHGQRAWLREGDATTETPSPWERVRRGWLWITNWILWTSSGYGERPKRVIVSSVAIIVFFMLIYEFVWAVTAATRPSQLDGWTGSFSYSAEMFTSIILGGSEVQNEVIRLISYLEGFVGSFFIALFVLTITRSVRR